MWSSVSTSVFQFYVFFALKLVLVLLSRKLILSLMIGVWEWRFMFDSVSFFYEVGNFWGEVWVVVSYVAFWNVVFVCVLYDAVEFGDVFVYVFYRSAVQCAEVLFCLFSEFCPVCFLVVFVCVV